MHAPGTNNGAESCIKGTRADGNNVVANVAAVLSFLFDQVRSIALDEWDPDAEYHIPAALWTKADCFASLFGSTCIRKLKSCGGFDIYFCNPREDPHSQDAD